MAGILNRPEPGKKVPLVILCHGYCTGRGKNGKRLVSVQEKLNQIGIATLRFDFSGHLESEGEFIDVTPTTGVDDLNYAIKFVENLDWVTSIGLFGNSFGGFASLYNAANNPRVKCLVLRSAAIDYVEIRLNLLEDIKSTPEEWKNKGYFIFRAIDGKEFRSGYKFFEESKKYNLYEEAKKIKIPTLIIHGEQDESVPVDQVKKVYDNISSNKDIVIFKNGDHLLNNKLDKIVEKSVEWFKKHLL